MLVVNEELVKIDDAIDCLVDDLLKCKTFQTYLEKKSLFENDSVLQKDILTFKDLAEEYDKRKHLISFRPELLDLRKEVYAKKRALDLHPKVVDLRLAEVDFQEILAQVTQAIADTVSSHIFVDTGLPLSPKKERFSLGIYQNIKEKDS